MISISAPLEVAPGLHVITRTPPHGFGWNVMVLQLPGGGTLVYSPSWLDDDTFARIDALGEPKVLCVPNAFHNVSLAQFRARYPAAKAVAAPAAMAHLTKRGHSGLLPVESVNALLPPGAQWHHCEGTKSGEVWLSVGRALLVGDAFFHFALPLSGLVGWLLKRLKVWPGLKVSTTYQFLAVRNVRTYRAWVLNEIAKIAPNTLVPSHGAALTASDLTQQLVRAVEARWPSG